MEITAIDLFSGAGGLSLGARLAGVKVVYAVDNDRHSAATYRQNFSDVELADTDIREVEPRRLPTVDLLLAGPPCQSFSTSNQRTRHDENPLNHMIFEPVRFIRALKPTYAVIENVAGLAIGTRRAFLETLCRQLEGIGYRVAVVHVSGHNVGLPQNRNRLFVIATKRRLLEIQLALTEQPTVRDAIGDLPTLENGHDVDVMPYGAVAPSDYARGLRGRMKRSGGHLVTNSAASIIDRFQHVPQGGNWKDIPVELMDNYSDVTRCHTGVYHRLVADRPSKVIGNFRKNMLIHPTIDRGLSIREAARLQSFPDDFAFSGSIGKRQQQVGNAVPPLMSRAIVSKIIDHIK